MSFSESAGHEAKTHAIQKQVTNGIDDTSIILDLTGIPRLNVFLVATYKNATAATTGIVVRLALGMQQAHAADGTFIFAGITYLVTTIVPTPTSQITQTQTISQFDPFAVVGTGLPRAIQLQIHNNDAANPVFIDCYGDET